MAKVYFRYGTMDSSKTARLLMDAHEYASRGESILLLKPTADTRSKQGMIESRIGLSAPCLDIDKDFNIYHHVLQLNDNISLSCILVDEAQFLTTMQVIHLRMIADNLNIPVMCYGLKTDFKGDLFEGARALFAHANRFEEVKTICREPSCMNKAMYNVRYKDGKPVFEGDVVLVGDTKKRKDNYYYIPKCSYHFFEDLVKYLKEKDAR